MATFSCSSVLCETLTSPDLVRQGTFLFASTGTEARGRIAVWDEVARNHPERSIEVVQQSVDTMVIRRKGVDAELALRDLASIARLVQEAPPLCMDMSGLAHQVWAAIVAAASISQTPISVVYAEPKRYRPHPSPAFPDLFDLSKSFGGLAPLPGLARLTEPAPSRPTAFVAFLGFEGRRPSRLALSLDPQPKVISVVGVPGFRVEYPTFTVACNAGFLSDFRGHSDLRFAAAHCPHEAYATLAAIRRDHPEHYLYIAPVGTKPHALGAVCYAILHPNDSELMYDHPTRHPKRTDGVGPVHVYTLSLDA